MNTHKAANWVVYFNGIEVPAMSADVSSQIGDIPQAKVTLPPDATMRRIGAEDRVRMTLFFQDPVEDDMRLLFDGEIVSYQYNNTGQGRALTYVATDLISVLTQMFPIFIGGLNSLMQNVVGTINNSIGRAISPFAVSFSLFTVGLAGGETIKRPYDFVSNIVRLLTGEGVAESQRSVISSHWFTRWLERTKFAERLFPSYDTLEMRLNSSGGFPILEATQKMSVLNTLAKMGDKIATNNSYYVMLQSMLQNVYYELNPVLAPPCVTMNLSSHDIYGSPEEQLTHSFYDERLEEEDVPVGPIQEGLGLVQHVAQPKNFFGIPPKCNVFWPSIIENHSYSENFAVQPTRTYLGNSELIRVISRGQLRELEDFTTTVGYPKQAQAALDNITAGEGETNPNNFLVYPEEFFRGPVYNKTGVSTWFSMLNEDEQLPTAEEGSDENLNRLQKIYAAMEHHRTRLSKRNGAVQMAFNPYPLLGHPCVTLDNEESNQHTFGYVVSISHSFSQTHNTTNVSYSYGRTFEEFFESYVKHAFEYNELDVFADTEEFSGSHVSYASSPFYPVKSLRDKFQNYDGAREYFGRTFWRREDRHVMFDWPMIVGVRTESGDIDRISLKPDNLNAVARENEGYIPVYAILPSFQGFMNDAEGAFRYAYRPVCTMEEYVAFQGEYGVKEGLRLPKNPREGKTAPYYVKILNFEQGPGVEPGETATGGRCGPLSVDTRRNWEVRLLKFREKVYQSDNHFRA